MSLDEITLRRFHWTDLAAIVEVMNRVAAAYRDDDRWTLDEIRHNFEMPDFNPEVDTIVAVNLAGQVVGVDSVEKEAVYGRGWAEGYVHPAYWRRGIGRQLARHTDAYLLRVMERHVTDESPIYIYRHADDQHAGALALFAAEGYKLARYFYRMLKELDTPVDVPPLPAGIIARPFDHETDAYAVYRAQQESFRDHWGHGDNVPFEHWQHHFADPNFDPSLWLVAYAGDEVVGVCLSRPFGEDQPDMGYIGALGVRKLWRRRGLGTALLLRAFREFQERGYRRVSLGVDAENATNAVALYERVGMQVNKRTLVWRKVLRGNEADISE